MVIVDHQRVNLGHRSKDCQWRVAVLFGEISLFVWYNGYSRLFISSEARNLLESLPLLYYGTELRPNGEITANSLCNAKCL